MSIHPNEILFWAGGNVLQKYGTIIRRTSPVSEPRETFVRGSPASLIGRDGRLRQAGNDRLRIEWVDLDGDGVRETAVVVTESAMTNYVPESEDFGSWSTNGSGTRVGGVADPAGGTDAWLLTDTDAALNYAVTFEDLPLAADVTRVLSLFVREGGNSPDGGAEIGLFDRTVQTWRGSILLTWQGGAPILTPFQAAPTVLPTVALEDGWYRIGIRIDGSLAANSNAFVIQPAGTILGETGDLHVFGAQVENSRVLTSYRRTQGSTAIRAQDTLWLPYNARPQAMSIYIRMVEAGSAFLAGESTIVAVGSATGESVRIRSTAAGAGYSARFVTDTSSANTGTLPVPDLGDEVEILLTLAADGAMTLHQSIHGAGATSTGSAGVPLPAAWGQPRVWIGSLGGLNPGIVHLRDVVIASGVRTLDEMREVVG